MSRPQQEHEESLSQFSASIFSIIDDTEREMLNFDEERVLIRKFREDSASISKELERVDLYNRQESLSSRRVNA